MSLPGDAAAAIAISPLTEGRAARACAISEACPRRTSSWSFVSSRPRTTGGSPHALASASSDSAIRKGDSKSTVVPGRVAYAAYQRSRSPRREGGKPRNVNGTTGNPEIERIASTADGPGTAPHGVPGGGAPRGEPLAGIGDERRARVGDESQRLASGEPLESLADAAVFVVAVAGHARRREAVAREEVSRAPGVLAVDDGCRRQRLERPRREVVEVSDRRGDDEETAHCAILSRPRPRRARRLSGSFMGFAAYKSGAWNVMALY